MRTPNLLLKPSAYKTDKLYSILPDDGGGDFTVNGYVGNGTRVNSEGLIETVATDTPRIDYLGGPGLLLEPARTNLMTYTAASSGWSTTGQLTSNNEIAPDGTYTATRHEDDDAASSEATTKSTTISALTTYTFSIFIKFGNNEKVNLGLSTTAGTTASTTHLLYPDGTWTVNTDASGIIDDSGSDNYGNGWYRFYATFTSLTGNTGVNITMYPSYGNFDVEPQGYYWFWGNQLEAGAFMTSLIPTVASSLERIYDRVQIADALSAGLTSTSTGFISLKVDDLQYKTPFSSNILFEIGGSLGRVQLLMIGAAPTVRVSNSDATVEAYSLTNKNHRIGFNFNWDNVDIWVDGVKVASSAKEFYLTSGQVDIKGLSSSYKLQELTMYNQLITDAEAKALTS